MKTAIAKEFTTTQKQTIEKIIHVWNHRPQMQQNIENISFFLYF